MLEEHQIDLILFFFELRQNLYLYHLTTLSYSRHNATGNFVDKMDDLIDKFLEVYFSKYGRPDSFKSTSSISTLSDSDAYFKLLEYIEILTNKIPEMINPVKDTDLLTIRDEMLVVLNNTKYLYELH